MSTHRRHMTRAIELAKMQQGRTGVNPSVGCVILDRDARLVSEAATGDGGRPHAEQLALAKAPVGAAAGGTAYVTLEPCPMCAAAISFARIRRLYFGCEDPKSGAVESGVRYYSDPSCHHCPDVYSGIAEEECSKILKDFFQKQR